MTQEQYERWKDFSLRMARTCFKRRRNPTAKEIAANVADFFDCLDSEDRLSIVNWDHSAPYPEGSSNYCRTYRCPCWNCSKSNAESPCPYHCEDGSIYDYASAGFVCDTCAELSENWNPYYWSDLSESEYGRRDEQFTGPVRCCIRAGLDVAVSPSMGVMGFTAGDLRRMYPEGVPDWVTGGPGHRWTTEHFVGVVPGVGLVPGKSELNGTFAEMPDSAELWL